MRAAFARFVSIFGVLACGLAGCAAQPPAAAGGPADNPAYDIGVRRGPAGLAVADIPQRDCDVFRLLAGGHVCKPVPPPPERPRYCTRGLAGADCWAAPNPFGYYQRGVADGPWQLTRTQEHDRSGEWPKPELLIEPSGMPPGQGPSPLAPPAIIEPPITAP